MNVKFYASDLHACGHVRGEVIARAVNKRGNHRIDLKAQLMISDIPDTSIAIFQRSYKRHLFDRMMLMKEHGIKCVYEVDDDLFNVPKEFAKPHAMFCKPEVRKCMTDFLNHADAITVCSQHLGQIIQRDVNPNTPIYVVENCVDIDRWDVSVPKRNGQITIGWMASQSHQQDIPLIADSLYRLMEERPNVFLRFIGWIGMGELGDRFNKFSHRISTSNWIDINELPNHMAAFDIGLSPIVDNDYNRGRSFIKVLQYGAQRTPCVASKVVPNMEIIKHGINGFLAEGDEWYHLLKDLVDSEELRKKTGEEAYQTAKRFDAPVMAVCWEKVFDLIAER